MKRCLIWNFFLGRLLLKRDRFCFVDVWDSENMFGSTQWEQSGDGLFQGNPLSWNLPDQYFSSPRNTPFLMEEWIKRNIKRDRFPSAIYPSRERISRESEYLVLCILIFASVIPSCKHGALMAEMCAATCKCYVNMVWGGLQRSYKDFMQT